MKETLLSRRQFLKLSSTAVMSLLLPGWAKAAELPAGQQARVAEEKIEIYDAPSFSARPLKTYWRDMVLPIAAVTLGDNQPEFNRVWYQIGDEGYAHSGPLQPVRTQLNQAVEAVPDQGALAEVTVPFTDAHWRADKNYPVAYRLYYTTTHWVIGLAHDQRGRPWYRLRDDKWKFHYFVPAAHLRLLPPEELAPISAELPAEAKRIEVLTGPQIVVAYEHDQPVFMGRTATGARFSNGDFSTPPGVHVTSHKRPFRHMAAGNLAYNGYDLPGVPWISYITESGISFHGTYWHNNFGRPRSHGCINLTPQDAKWIYRWTLPSVPVGEQEVIESTGTRVDVIPPEES
jgi:lipoprotein-anchoring transpeptidase ErfK/SrfK